MRRYTLSQAAETDLTAIASYTVETFGIDQAIAYRDGLIRTFEFLAEHPRAARLRDELRPPLRVHRFQSHLILYDVQPNGGIFIVRIRHGREDWAAGEEH